MLLLATACGGAGTAPAPPISVLLITVDTLRPDYLSLNGYDRETTPFLDSLLSRGFYFEDAISPIARTTPALASLLTGAYPHATGVRTLFHALSDEVVTVTEVLGERGYQTLAVVTNQVLSRNRRLARGFDHYEVGHAARRGPATTDAALSALAGLESRRAFFAWVHYFDPHTPYHPEPALAREFDPDYSGRYRLQFGWQPRPGEGPGALRPYPVDLPKVEAVHRNALPGEVNDHVRRLYAAEIRGLDTEIERLVRAFRRVAGPELLIVFTADHGESLGEHDFYYDHGDYAYLAGTRVPLAFVLPESHVDSGAGRCPGWVSLVDVVPTLLELLGFEPPPALAGQLEGRALTACMRGEALPPTPIFAESGASHFFEEIDRRVRNDVDGRFRAVVLGDWKLIWTPFASEDRAWELYDVTSDPDETENLYRADRPEAIRLKPHLTAWMARAAAHGSAPESGPSDRDLDALRELGYVE